MDRILCANHSIDYNETGVITSKIVDAPQLDDIGNIYILIHEYYNILSFQNKAYYNWFSVINDVDKFKICLF